MADADGCGLEIRGNDIVHFLFSLSRRRQFCKIVMLKQVMDNWILQKILCAAHVKND